MQRKALTEGAIVRFNDDGTETVINPNASEDVQPMQTTEAGE